MIHHEERALRACEVLRVPEPSAVARGFTPRAHQGVLNGKKT